MTRLLIRGAEVDGRIHDIRVASGTVIDVGSGLLPTAGEDVIEASGGALLPGLHDAHIHLLALAASTRSVVCGPPAVRDRASLAASLAGAQADSTGWVRGIGYIETVAGDLNARILDQMHGQRPVRIQHRSGALWTVNTAGARVLGLADADHAGVERAPDGTPTGRLWRADPWLRHRLGPAPPPDLASVGRGLARVGITSVADATPDLDEDTVTLLAGARESGAFPQHLQVLGAPLHGGRLPPVLAPGPYKIVLADSGLLDLDDLVDRIRTAHDAGRPVAVHCVTREALVLLLAAQQCAGTAPGDRIEHAALVPAEVVQDLARRGLRVVTQPGFITDRGDDYLRDVPVDEHADLYRCRSLLEAGVPVALSSDAPYGPLDPWSVISAAVDRRTATGAVIGPVETLSASQALAAYLSIPDHPGGPPRRVRPGARADLILLDRPLPAQLAAPTAAAVRTVLIGGQLVHRTR